MKFRDDSRRGTAAAGSGSQPTTVGKRSPLDSAFRAQSVQQRRAAAPAETTTADVHAAADAGIATPGGSLPHQAALEAAFEQDLSGVEAHVGGDAAASAEAMGADAYATGDHVVLPANPGLDVVAHEVAHVLQQRDGVQLHGGVGAAGDAYEQEADAAAAAAVAGTSAAAVMRNPYAGVRRGRGAIQKKEAATAPPADEPTGGTGAGIAELDAGAQKRREDMLAALSLVPERWKTIGGDVFTPAETASASPTELRQKVYDLLFADAKDLTQVKDPQDATTRAQTQDVELKIVQIVLAAPGRESQARAYAQAGAMLRSDLPRLLAIRSDIDDLCRGGDLTYDATRLLANHALLSPMGKHAVGKNPVHGKPTLAAYVDGDCEKHARMLADTGGMAQFWEEREAVERRADGCKHLVTVLQTGENAPLPAIDAPAPAAEAEDPLKEQARTVADAIRKELGPPGKPVTLSDDGFARIRTLLAQTDGKVLDRVYADAELTRQLVQCVDPAQAKVIVTQLDSLEALYQAIVPSYQRELKQLAQHSHQPVADESQRRIAAGGEAYQAVKAWLLARPGEQQHTTRLRLLGHTRLKDDVVDRFPDVDRRMIYRMIATGSVEASPEDAIHEAAETGKPEQVAEQLLALASSNPGRLKALERNEQFYRTVERMTTPVPVGELMIAPFDLCLTMWGRRPGASYDPGVAALTEVNATGDDRPLNAEEMFTLKTGLFGWAIDAIHDQISGKAAAKELDEASTGTKVLTALSAVGPSSYLVQQQRKERMVDNIRLLLVEFDHRAASDTYRPLLQRARLVAGPELETRFAADHHFSLRTWIYENMGPRNRSGAARILGSEQGSSVGVFNGQVLLAGEGPANAQMSIHQALRETTYADRPLTEWASVSSRVIGEAMGDGNKNALLGEWTQFSVAVAMSATMLQQRTGMVIRALDLLRNAYMEHSGHFETRLGQKFKGQDLADIQKALGLDVEAAEAAKHQSPEQQAEAAFGTTATELWDALRVLAVAGEVALVGLPVARQALANGRALPALGEGAPSGETEERPPRTFRGFYRHRYGTDPELHAAATVRTFTDADLRRSAAEQLGLPAGAVDHPPVAPTEKLIIGDSNRKLVRASFTVDDATARAEKMWRVLHAGGSISTIVADVYGDCNDEEQRLVRIAFRELSGGFDLLFYIRQAMAAREDEKDRPRSYGGYDPAMFQPAGAKTTTARVGAEGTAAGRKVAPLGWGQVHVQGSETELDAALAVATSGEIDHNTRLLTAAKRGDSDHVFRILDDLDRDELARVLRDGPLIALLQSKLNQHQWERAFKTITGQADLADRLYSRSHGKGRLERVFGGTDEEGMREDMPAYVRRLRLKFDREVRAELTAKGVPASDPGAQQVIDGEINRRLIDALGHLRSNQAVQDILKHELDDDELAEMEGHLRAEGEAQWAALIGGKGASAILAEIRSMSPAQRKERLADPAYLRMLGDRLTSEKDYRDAMNALTAEDERSGDGALGRLEAASRAGDVVEGGTSDRKKILQALSELTPAEYKRLAADAGLQMQVIQALPEADRALGRQLMSFRFVAEDAAAAAAGKVDPGASADARRQQEQAAADRIEDERLEFLVHGTVGRLQVGVRRRAWLYVLQAAVEAYKVDLTRRKVGPSAADSNEPAEAAPTVRHLAEGKAAPATDPDAEAKRAASASRALRSRIWTIVQGEVRAFAMEAKADDKRVNDDSVAEMVQIVEDAVMRRADPSNALIDEQIITTEEKLGALTGAERERQRALFGDRFRPDATYNEDDLKTTLRTATDEHVVAHWLNVTRPSADGSPTMADVYGQYRAAHDQATTALKARRPNQVDTSAATAPDGAAIEASAGTGPDLAAPRLPKPPPPQAPSTVAAGGADVKKLMDESDHKRRLFLQFVLGVSHVFEELLLPFMGDDRTFSTAQKGPKTRGRDNKRFNDMAEIVLGRSARLSPAVVGAALGIDESDAWILSDPTRAAMARTNLHDEKFQRALGEQNRVSGYGQDEREQYIEAHTREGRAQSVMLSGDGAIDQAEAKELGRLGDETERAGLAYKTALETAAGWAALIVGALIATVLTVITFGAALGPAAMLMVGAAATFLSAGAKALVMENILQGEYDKEDAVKDITKEVITGLVTLGTTYFAQRILATVGAAAKLGGQMSKTRQVLNQRPPLWRSFLHEGAEEVISESMTGVVEAGLEATDPMHWMYGAQEGADRAYAAGMARLAQTDEQALRGGFTAIITSGAGRFIKRRGAGGKILEPSQLKRQSQLTKALKHGLGGQDDKLLETSVQWLMEQMEKPEGIDWSNAPSDLLKGYLEEVSEGTTESLTSAGHRHRRDKDYKQDIAHAEKAGTFTTAAERADFDRMRAGALDTDVYVSPQEFVNIRHQVAVAGMTSWQSRTGQRLTPAQAEAFVRYVREAPSAKELQRRAASDPLAQSSVRDADPTAPRAPTAAGLDVIGTVPTAAEGHEIMRRLAAGDATALEPFGVPASGPTDQVEWGLGQMPDGTVHLVRGRSGDVDFDQIPGMKALAHSHPFVKDGASRALKAATTAQGVAVDALIRGNMRDRVHFLPSTGDLGYFALGGVQTHIVYTPYVHLGDGRIGNPTGDTPASQRIEIIVQDAFVAGHATDRPTVPAFGASIIVRAGDGTVIWHGPIYAMKTPELGDVLSTTPANISLTTPATAAPGEVAPHDRPTIPSMQAVTPPPDVATDVATDVPAHERPTGQYEVVVPASERPTGQMDVATPTVDPAHDDLARIRGGTPGTIRTEAELSNADVTRSLNEQLQPIKAGDVDAVIAAFPQHEQAGARLVMARASGFGNMESLNAIRVAMQETLADGRPLFTPGSGSLADNIAYSSSKGSYENVAGADGSEILTTKELRHGCVVVLDDVVLQRIKTDSDFAQELVDRDCVLLEPHGFGAGITMFNATSPEAISKRTAEILVRARQIESAGMGAIDLGMAIDIALGEQSKAILDRASSELSGRVRTVHPTAVPDLSSQAIAHQLSGDAGITEEQLEQALAGLDADMQRYARELLAHQGDVFSPRRFANDLVQQHQKMLAMAASRGVAAENVYFYIPKGGKSYGMIAMAHRQATGTAVSRYINGPEDLADSDLGADSLIVVMDDVAGSGDSLHQAVDAINATPYPGHVIVSPLVSTEVARDLFTNPALGVAGSRANLTYEPRQMSRALTESAFFQNLSPADQVKVRALVDKMGFGDNALSLAFPYMAPDNNSTFFGDLVAKYFIVNKNRMASKVGAYTPPPGSPGTDAAAPPTIDPSTYVPNPPSGPPAPPEPDWGTHSSATTDAVPTAVEDVPTGKTTAATTAVPAEPDWNSHGTPQTPFDATATRKAIIAASKHAKAGGNLEAATAAIRALPGGSRLEVVADATPDPLGQHQVRLRHARTFVLALGEATANDVGKRAVQALHDLGLHVTLTVGEGSFSQGKRINIDPLMTDDPVELAGILVHEAHHALTYANDVKIGMTRDQYVAASLRNEGEAQAEEIEFFKKVSPSLAASAAGGSTYHPAYAQAAAEYRAAHPDATPEEVHAHAKEAGIRALASVFGDLVPSTSIDRHGQLKPGAPATYAESYGRFHDLNAPGGLVASNAPPMPMAHPLTESQTPDHEIDHEIDQEIDRDTEQDLDEQPGGEITGAAAALHRSAFKGNAGRKNNEAPIATAEIGPHAIRAATILGEDICRLETIGADSRVVVTANGRAVTLHFTAGRIAGGAVATFDFDPTSTQDVVNVVISSGARRQDLARAIAHEIGEIHAFLVDPTRAVRPEPTADLAFRPDRLRGAVKRPASMRELSAHDMGRVFELRVLAEDLATAPDVRRREILLEIDATLTDLNLDWQAVRHGDNLLGPATARLLRAETELQVPLPSLAHVGSGTELGAMLDRWIADLEDQLDGGAAGAQGDGIERDHQRRLETLLATLSDLRLQVARGLGFEAAVAIIVAAGRDANVAGLRSRQELELPGHQHDDVIYGIAVEIAAEVRAAAPPAAHDAAATGFEQMMRDARAAYRTAAGGGTNPFDFGGHSLFVGGAAAYVVPAASAAALTDPGLHSADKAVRVAAENARQAALEPYAYSHFSAWTVADLRRIGDAIARGDQVSLTEAVIFMASMVAEADRNHVADVTNLLLLGDPSAQATPAFGVRPTASNPRTRPPAFPMATGGTISDPSDPGLASLMAGSATAAGTVSDQEIDLIKAHYERATGQPLVDAIDAATDDPATIPARRDEIVDVLRRLLYRGQP
jgi:hypothetical protein